MLTRQELILQFMLALSSNGNITKDITSADDVVIAAASLADAYLKTLG
jgi:hypothetical protein